MISFKIHSRERGFTLVEAIIVMVITGILAGMVAVFIRTPIQSYVDTAARAELSDIADLSLRRISRELRLALPNSVQSLPNISQPAVTSNDTYYIQFLLTKTGGRYISARDMPPSTVKPLSFIDTNAKTFNMAGLAPTGRQAIVPGDYIVVYNLSPGQAPADAYTGQNVSQVTAISGTLVTLNANPFAAATIQMPSPDSRFQVVSGVVTYKCVQDPNGMGTLTRYFSTVVPPTSALPNTPGTAALLANRVKKCEFTSDQLANMNAALVTTSLTLRHSNKEEVTLVRQVQVNNTP